MYVCHLLIILWFLIVNVSHLNVFVGACTNCVAVGMKRRFVSNPRPGPALISCYQVCTATGDSPIPVTWVSLKIWCNHRLHQTQQYRVLTRGCGGKKESKETVEFSLLRYKVDPRPCSHPHWLWVCRLVKHSTGPRKSNYNRRIQT